MLMSVRMMSNACCGSILRASNPLPTSTGCTSGTVEREEMIIPRMIGESSTTNAVFNQASFELQRLYFTMEQRVFHSDTRLDHENFEPLEVFDSAFTDRVIAVKQGNNLVVGDQGKHGNLGR